MLIPPQLSAQEVYLSISGKDAIVDSGDLKGEYDFWIRPLGDHNPESPVRLEIFDAALGGHGDLVFDGSVETTYEIIPFSELYRKEEQSIVRISDEGRVLQSETVLDQSRFHNRWVSMFDIGTGEEMGYVLRVRTGEGTDVNTFKLRMAGPERANWEIIAFDLSFSLVGTSFSDRIFLQPLFDTTEPEDVRILGEEETEVFYIDAFGNTASATRPWTDWERSFRDIPNAWGFMTTGAQQYYNNMVIEGADDVVPFVYNYQLFSSEDVPQPRIASFPGSACEEGGLSLSFSGVGLDIHNARWYIEDEVYTGRQFTHSFSSYGYFPFEVAVPVTGRIFPRYVIQSGSIPVHRPPNISISGAADYIAPGEAMVLDASGTYDPEGYSIRFEWFVNGELRGTDQQFSFSTQTPGSYNVSLNVTSDGPNSECALSDEIVRVRVNSQPYAEISHDDVIARDYEAQLRVINEQDADGDPLQFFWDGDGIVGEPEGRTVSVRHADPGNYTVRLTVDDQTGTGNAQYSTSVSYKVNAEPEPRFELPDIVATGQPVQLDGNASSDPDGDPLAFSWEVSDGRELNGPVNEIDFSEPGDYAVTLRVDDGEGVENSVQSLSRNIRVNHPPVAVISAPGHVNRSRVVFSAADSYDTDQGIQDYQWDFGDGRTGTGEETSHLYQAPGVYEITLTVDDGTGLANSATSTRHELRINSNPVADISVPGLVAPGQSFVLDGSGSHDHDGEITGFQWFVNDRPFETGSRSEARLDEPGEHKISLKVRDDSGFDDAYDIATTTIRVNHPPVIKWTSDPKITEPERPTRFSAAQSHDPDNEDLQFTWFFEDDVVLEGETVERAFGNAGYHRFTLRADDGEGLANSVSEQTGTITVNHEPIIVTDAEIRSNKKKVRLDASQSYDPQNNPLTYTWELPDGTTRNDAAFTWTAPEPGTHWLSLTLDDGLGLANSRLSMPVRVTVNQPPVAVVDSLIMSCTGQSIIFSSALSYDPDDDQFRTHWDFDDGNTSPQSNPHHSYSEPGIYQVRLTLDDGFSSDKSVAVIPVVVEGSPQARMNFEEITVCTNTPVTFDGSASSDPSGQVGSHNWEFGDDTHARGAKATHFYDEPGSYDVVLTVTGSGSGNCPNMSQITARVNVVEGPTARFDVTEVVSPGTPVQLDASDSDYMDEIRSVTWEVYRGDDDQSDDQPYEVLSGMQTSLRPSEPDRYRVRLILETASQTDCNRSVHERIFQVNAAPVIAWNTPDTLARHEPFMLSADGSHDSDGFISEYAWYLNDENIGTGITTLLPTDVHGEHTLRLLVRDNSGVENDYDEKETTFFINAAPNPDFEVPEVVYRGETVSLSPASNRDEDGDALRSSWLINGEEVSQPVFEATERKYTITLIQDDGRGLSNSVMQKDRILNVRFPVAATPDIPSPIVLSHSLTANDIGLPESYVLLDGNRTISSWEPESTGNNIIHYGWKPSDSVLDRFEASIDVIGDLRFSEPSVELTTEWNPANPSVTVTAPEVNRDQDRRVIITWNKDGQRIAAGRTVRLPVEQGENHFTISARDNHVAGSEAVEIPVVISVFE